MQLILLTKNPKLYSIQRVVTEANSLRLNPTIINPLEYELLNTPTSLNLHDEILLHRTTGSNFDEIDLHISRSRELAGSLIVNSLGELKIFRDKGNQALFFLEHKLSSIPTLMLRGAPTFERLLKLKESWNYFLNTRDEFIVKTNRGSGGVGVILSSGIPSLYSLLEAQHAMGDQRFLLQPFLDEALEYRLFFIRNQCYIYAQKEKTGIEFRGNRGRANLKIISKEELPKKALTLFEALLDKTTSLYGAIDLLHYKGESYLLEFNSVPGFFEIEKESKNNIAKMILDAAIDAKRKCT